jgi:glycolate oxidase iron-sulfur subunit
VTPRGRRQARVALLAGCVEQVLRPTVFEAAVEVLTHHGVEVVVPPGQGCCGSLALHSGEDDLARSLARRNLAAFPDDVDAILSTAAGCGSGMRSYPQLFAGSAEEERASRFASRVRDVSSFLDGLGVRWPRLEPGPVVAYHDPCHLAHAQRERAAPRRLLTAVGATLVEPADWELCCGSAGIYNLEHPEVASRLGEQKARALLATGAEVLASGNIGCLVQIGRHLDRLGEERPLLHTVELLARACRRSAAA